MTEQDREDDRQAQLESIVENQRADTRIVQSEIDWEQVAFAMRQPMLRDKIAYLIDHTAYLGTPEVIYRRRPHESTKEASNRLNIEVLETADEIIALLFSLGLIPKGYR